MADFNDKQMLALTHAVVRCLDEWQVSTDDMLSVLGLEKLIKPRQLGSYRQGHQAFPRVPEVMQRIDHIVGITDALRTTFPFSDQMRVMWLKKPHRRFQKRTPLVVMLEEGANGLQKVRIEVDCSYGYAIADALQGTKSC